MKQFILATLLILVPSFTNAQDQFADLPFETKSSFKQGEPEILKMTNYILENPGNDSDAKRLTALRNIIKWMSGTPDYMFSLDESLSAVMKKNDAVVGLYMTALAKTALEKPEISKDQNQMKLNAFTLLLNYCENPVNGVKQTKELKKAIEAKNSGQLNAYLKI